MLPAKRKNAKTDTWAVIPMAPEKKKVVKELPFNSKVLPKKKVK